MADLSMDPDQEIDMEAFRKWQKAFHQANKQEEKQPETQPTFYNENSKFKIGDTVYVRGQVQLMTVVRCYIDDKAGPMVEVCWVKTDREMQLASLPEAVYFRG